MTFEEILDHAIAMLQRRGRLTYSTLKRQFQLDDAALEDLKNELIAGQRLAVDEGGNVLVWTGAEGSAPHPTTPPASSQDRPPLAYTPQYLAEKVLHSRAALEGERKQVTVLFADLRACLKSGLRGTIVALLEPEMEGTDVTTLPHRSHRCGMDSSRAVHSSGQTRWPPAYDRHARGGECHLLYLAERVSMASAPARLSVSPDGLPLLPDLGAMQGCGSACTTPCVGISARPLAARVSPVPGSSTVRR